MFGLGKTTAKEAALIVELRKDGTYIINKDSRVHIRPYNWLNDGINALLFVKKCDVEDEPTTR